MATSTAPHAPGRAKCRPPGGRPGSPPPRASPPLPRRAFRPRRFPRLPQRRGGGRAGPGGGGRGRGAAQWAAAGPQASLLPAWRGPRPGPSPPPQPRGGVGPALRPPPPPPHRAGRRLPFPLPPAPAPCVRALLAGLFSPRRPPARPGPCRARGEPRLEEEAAAAAGGRGRREKGGRETGMKHSPVPPPPS